MAQVKEVDIHVFVFLILQILCTAEVSAFGVSKCSKRSVLYRNKWPQNGA